MLFPGAAEDWGVVTVKERKSVPMHEHRRVVLEWADQLIWSATSSTVTCILALVFIIAECKLAAFVPVVVHGTFSAFALVVLTDWRSKVK